jgi:hypothetical protein
MSRSRSAVQRESAYRQRDGVKRIFFTAPADHIFAESNQQRSLIFPPIA